MTIDRTQQWPFPGARWWKFDLHTHTPASSDYGKGPQQAALRKIEPSEWLLGFMRAGVDCVAVTDHNSGEWIDPLQAALTGLSEHDDYRPLCLFPGVEITASGGIHILAVLGGDKGAADVSGLLGAVRYRGTWGASDRAADASPIEVVEAIAGMGGIPILAHADGPAGAWCLRGNTLTSLLDFNDLFAVEVADPTSPKPDLYHQRGLAWAEVLGSDSHHPFGSAGHSHPGSHYTWVKMAKPSLEGLRLALLDGRRFSIRRSDEPGPFNPFEVPERMIEAVELREARYMGRGVPAKVRFSPWLNALVGGRGTGKSTVVHALRLAARRESELDSFDEAAEPRATFGRFNRVPADRLADGGLTASTTIEWLTTNDDLRYRVHWRQDGGGTPVEQETENSGWAPSHTQTVSPDRFPVRIFSQGQIAALAGPNQEALVGVIDDAAGVAILKRRLQDTRRQFAAMRAQVREIDGKLAGRDELVVKQERIDRKLRRFEEAGHAEVLTEYRRRGRQRRESERQFSAATATADRIRALAVSLAPEDLPRGLFDRASEADRQVAHAIDDLADAIRSAAQELHGVGQRLMEAVTLGRGVLDGGGWSSAARQADGDYERLVETLKAEGVTDPNEYGQLAQARQQLDGDFADLDSKKEERDKLADRCDDLLQQLVDDRHAISMARQAFLTRTLAQNDFVRIRNLPYGDEPRVIERSLRETLDAPEHFEKDILVMDEGRPDSGCVADLLAGLPTGGEQRSAEMERRLGQLKERVSAASEGKGGFGGHFSNFLARETTKRPEMLDRLLTWFPEDGLSVEYSRQGNGKDFQPIAQASAGQRSAAMLAFLLAHGEEPLVLDQPEDDLDNHLIYDLVVRQIRENKLRRQIIVVTHNPNVVVNGDAEMLHVLDFRNGQCRVVQSGSLQEKEIRDEVCTVMEGGREAFERRYRRLR